MEKSSLAKIIREVSNYRTGYWGKHEHISLVTKTVRKFQTSKKGSNEKVTCFIYIKLHSISEKKVFIAVAFRQFNLLMTSCVTFSTQNR